jgi:NADPH:quinone reductase-like Zn-dependent oxidoreductase
VLIHAGAEAVGRAAIQLAKHLGLQVITTASTASIKFVRLARHRRVSPLLWPVLAAMGAKPHMAARRAGANYRSWFMRADGLQLESLNPLLEVGVVRPHIDRVSPFAQTAQAIAYAEAGKVVLQMQPN